MVGFWWRYIVRSLRRGGTRSLFALLCVTVGVAGVVALQTAANTVQVALTSNVRAANGGDISVAAYATPLSTGDLRIFARLQREGRIRTWTAVSSVRATAVGPAGALVPFSVDVVAASYPVGGEPTFVTPANGRVQELLSRPGDVLLTSVLADELRAGVGDSLLVRSVGGAGLRATVRGILAETSFEHAAVMTVNRRDAGLLATGPPRYTAVYLTTPAGSATLARLLRARFPVATVQTVREALQSAQLQVHDFRQFMLLVGLLALLISGIGILNAMQSALARRRLEIAMLKTIGFGNRALYAMIGGEALLLGALGGVAGTALGAIASTVITQTLAAALAIQVTFQLDATTLVSGVVLGTAATVIFALLPMARAASYRPLEVLREGTGAAAHAGASETLGLLALVLLLFGGIAAIALGDPLIAVEFVGGAALVCAVLSGLFSGVVAWLSRLGPPASRAAALAVLLGLASLLLVSLVWLPALAALAGVALLLWAVTVLVPESHRLALILAVRALGRRRGRTSVILVAFLVGVLAMSLTMTVALSLNRQIDDALRATNTANLVAVADAAAERSVRAAARRLPGIVGASSVLVLQTSPVSVNGRPVRDIVGALPPAPGRDAEDSPAGGLDSLTGVEPRGGAWSRTIRVVEGRGLSQADAGTNQVLLRQGLRFSPWKLRVGDRLVLRQAGTGVRRTAVVRGFYRHAARHGFTSLFTGSMYADRAFAMALGAGNAQAVVSFSVQPAYLSRDATALQAAVPGVLILNVGDLTRIIETILGELLNVLGVITALSLGAGLAVVGNGVALTMLERRRELALLKAIGFGPARVLRFVLLENALVGVIAGASSTVCLVVALALLSRLALNTPIWFDPGVAVLVMLGATGLAMGTAYLSARGPLTVRPIEALRNE